MSKEQNSGVFQLENGCWGYRFIVTVDGKRKAQKRVKDEMGKLISKRKSKSMKSSMQHKGSRMKCSS